MIDPADMGDLQLEDVEDYSSDYPPVGFPKAEENIHSAEFVADKKTSRVSQIVTYLKSNLWTASLGGVIFIVLIIVISISTGGGGKKDQVIASEVPTHQEPVKVDPQTIDQSVKDNLMESIESLYDRHGLDKSPLAEGQDHTPQRKAFHWLASDEHLEKLSHSEKTQRYTMAVFYYATNQVKTAYTEDPKPWVSAHLWMTSSHVCEWKGIICNIQEHVEGIDLERNNLSGSLPSELTIISDSLLYLDLTSNLIHMEDSDFDIFRNLVNLKSLLMDDNYMVYDKGLPPQLRHCTDLEKLRLSYNLFSGELEVEHKVLEGMTKLTHLEIESNFLSGKMPDVIGTMKDLVYLYMRRNEMKFNLDFLKAGNLENLFALWLDNNIMTGTIPTEIGLMTELASLSLTNSTLSGPIPTEIGNLAGLRRLWLYSNQLTGQIPAELDNLVKLEVFEVHNNNLKGAMPQGVCELIEDAEYQYKSLTSDCKGGSVTCQTPECCTACY